MATVTDLTELNINYLTQTQYDEALENNQINANEIYFTVPTTVDDGGGIEDDMLLSSATIAKWNAILGA